LLWRDIHTNRVLEQLASERRYLFRHGGGEQKRLTTLRRQRNDAFHVTDEPHVEKPVGLIEHEHRDFREIDVPLTRQVQKATRSCDEDVETLG